MMSKGADVVVIGGGIIGSCCAYYLAKQGLKVILVERGEICSEASKSCQGHLFLWELPEINVRLGRESKKLYHQIADELDVDFELRNTGSMSVAESPQGLETLKNTIDELHRYGVKCELLDAKEFVKREPNISPGIEGGGYFPEDGQLNPLLTTIAIAQAAKKMGAELLTNTEVTGIELSKDKSKVAAIITNNGKIETSKVVNAAGAWSGQIGDMVGINIPVIPRKGNLLVVENVPDNFINCKIILASGYLDSLKGDKKVAVAANVQQTKEGNLLLGSSREFVGFDKNVNPEVISQIARRCIKFFPALAGLNTIRSWAGLRPFSPDMLPIISDSPIDGLYVASGHEGVGITMGPITGKLITQIITKQKTDLPVEQLSVNRFAKKK
jgi:sarcosine oxidase subunit beta